MLVIDEAGQVGTRDFALLAKAVERAGGVLVAVGDEHQLPSIDFGGVFGSMIRRFGGEHLKDITRQKDPAEREAVEKLAEGRGKEVFKEYARRGQLHVGENPRKTREELISHWEAAGGVQDPANNLIFVGTNQEVDYYNDLAQAERARAGKLDKSQKVRLDGETLFVCGQCRRRRQISPTRSRRSNRQESRIESRSHTRPIGGRDWRSSLFA